MHPFFKDRRWLLAYLSVWGLLSTVSVALLAPRSAAAWLQIVALAIPLTVLFGLATTPCWYLCRAMPLKWSAVIRALLAHAIAASVASLLWFGTTASVAGLLGFFLGSQAASVLIFDHRAGMIAVGALFYLLAAVFHYLLISLDAARQAEARAATLVVQAREAALNALKTQIHPHFLFNSLNAVSALVTHDTSQARRMCISLADFLRQSLRAGEIREISFAEELALVRSYLSVEKIRLGERLTVLEDVAAECERCFVLPLLLLPLVENAVRHGVSQLEAGGTVSIEANSSAGSLRLRVTNPYDPKIAVSSRGGRGLKSVHERLDTAYGSDAAMEVQAADGVYAVAINLPCRERL